MLSKAIKHFVPNCNNCIYNKDNKCKLFINHINLITNKIEYNYTGIARINKDMCGYYGKYYVENIKNIKNIKN
jgi:hypothetical protein